MPHVDAVDKPTAGGSLKLSFTHAATANSKVSERDISMVILIVIDHECTGAPYFPSTQKKKMPIKVYETSARDLSRDMLLTRIITHS